MAKGKAKARVKAPARKPTPRAKKADASTARPLPAGDGSSAAPFPVVGVGASAGGLEAFTKLLQHLPADTGMAFVLVQHLDPKHESILASLLSRATKMTVREAANQTHVEPDHVYVMPPNSNMTLVDSMLQLTRRLDTRAAHMPIDHFFHSLAGTQKHKAIGVILSGTASDGTAGLRAIKSEGGITFAQDSTAEQQSMPRSLQHCRLPANENSPRKRPSLALPSWIPYWRDALKPRRKHSSGHSCLVSTSKNPTALVSSFSTRSCLFHRTVFSGVSVWLRSSDNVCISLMSVAAAPMARKIEPYIKTVNT